MEILANRLLGMACYGAVGDALGRADVLTNKEFDELLTPLTFPLELRRPTMDEYWRDRPVPAWGGSTDQMLLGLDVWACLGDRQRHFAPQYLERLIRWRLTAPSRLIPRLADELNVTDNIRLRQLDQPGRGGDASIDKILLAVGRTALKTENYQDVLFAKDVSRRYWNKTQEATAGALPRAVAVAFAPILLVEKISLTQAVTQLTHADPLCVSAGVSLAMLLHRIIFDGEPPAHAALEALQAGRAILSNQEDLLEEWDSFLRDPETIRLSSLNDNVSDNHVLRVLGVVVWCAFELERAAAEHAAERKEPYDPEAPIVLNDAGKEILEKVVLERGDVGRAPFLVGALLGAVLGYNGMALDWLAATYGRGALEFCARRAMSRLGLKSGVQPTPIKVRKFRFRPANYTRYAYELDGQLWFHNEACGSREELEKWAHNHYRGMGRRASEFKW